MIDPLILDASDEPGLRPDELPEAATLPDPVAAGLFETQFDLFRSRGGRPRRPGRAPEPQGNGATAPNSEEAPARDKTPPHRDASAPGEREPVAAEEASTESAGDEGSVDEAAPPEAPSPEVEGETAEELKARFEGQGRRVRKVGEIDIDSHVPSLGKDKARDRAQNLEGADYRKIFSGPPARGAAAFSSSVLWPVALVLALGLPLILWPDLLGKVRDLRFDLWPTSPARSVRLDQGESFWLGGGRYWIRARATNRGEDTLAWIIVEAQARTPSMDSAVVQQSYCGKTLDEDEAARMTAAELRAYYATPGVRRSVGPGESVPCEVVLTGLDGVPTKSRVVVSDVGVAPRAKAGGRDLQRGGVPVEVPEAPASEAS